MPPSFWARVPRSPCMRTYACKTGLSRTCPKRETGRTRTRQKETTPGEVFFPTLALRFLLTSHFFFKKEVCNPRALPTPAVLDLEREARANACIVRVRDGVVAVYHRTALIPCGEPIGHWYATPGLLVPFLHIPPPSTRGCISAGGCPFGACSASSQAKSKKQAVRTAVHRDIKHASPVTCAKRTWVGRRSRARADLWFFGRVRTSGPVSSGGTDPSAFTSVGLAMSHFVRASKCACIAPLRRPRARRALRGARRVRSPETHKRARRAPPGVARPDTRAADQRGGVRARVFRRPRADRHVYVEPPKIDETFQVCRPPNFNARALRASE